MDHGCMYVCRYRYVVSPIHPACSSRYIHELAAELTLNRDEVVHYSWAYLSKYRWRSMLICDQRGGTID